jgi:hypothetical protein
VTVTFEQCPGADDRQPNETAISVEAQRVPLGRFAEVHRRARIADVQVSTSASWS